MIHFNASFEFPTLEDHYRTVLEKMSKEVLKYPMDVAKELEELLNRAFRANSIFGAVATLQFMLYVTAVISPFPSQHPLISSLIDQLSDPAARTWPTFFNNLRRTVTTRGLFLQALPSRDEPAKPTETALVVRENKDKKVSWKSLREDQDRGRSQRPPYYDRRHANSINSSQTQGDDYDEEDDYDHEDAPRDQLVPRDQLTLSLLESKMNAMNQSLSSRLQAQEDRQGAQFQSLMNSMSQHQSSMNALLQQRPAIGSGDAGSSGGHNSRGNNKRSRANSNKPWEQRPQQQQQQQSNPMDKYGPGGGGGGQPKSAHQAGDKRQRSDTRIDRYLHNPSGPENWKRWFRVCKGCGRYCAHFEIACKAPRRHNYNPSEDPRTVPPIEPYPTNYAAALGRAKEEYRIYGAQVKWNCSDQVAPTPDQLA
jgi:hypothetical protein